MQFAAHVFNPVRMDLSEDGQDKLPTVMNFGAAYTFSEKVMIAAEVEKDLDYDMMFKVGVEYQIIEMLELRAGVSTNPTLVSFGAGLNFKNTGHRPCRQLPPGAGVHPRCFRCLHFWKK